MNDIKTELVVKVQKDKEFRGFEHRDAILAEVAKAEPQIRAEQPALVERFMRVHAEDLAGYEFRCERFGAFLAVFVKRAVNKPPKDHLVAAINLGATPAIQLEPGHGVDMLGVVAVGASWLSDGAVAYRAYLNTDGEEQRRDYMIMTSHRPGGGGDDSFPFVRNIEACARHAKDDLVVFAGAVLHVPFGRGREVYDKVLAACK